MTSLPRLCNDALLLAPATPPPLPFEPVLVPAGVQTSIVDGAVQTGIVDEAGNTQKHFATAVMHARNQWSSKR